MNYYYITNRSNADPYFIRYALKNGVCAAQSIQEVVAKNNAYASGKGRLTKNDIAQLTGNALQTYLKKGCLL